MGADNCMLGMVLILAIGGVEVITQALDIELDRLDCLLLQGYY